MKHKKTVQRVIALAMTLVLLFSLAACGSDDAASSGKTEKTASETSDVKLPYAREDGINPYTAQSLLNQPIMPLLYESLYYMDANYQPRTELASSATQSGSTITVTLRSDKVFRDGSSVSASDVAYSFGLAKKSTYYATALTLFKSATAVGSNTVEFKLNKANKNAEADLTFPVVKAGSASKGSTPIGSGQYVYQASDSGGLLVRNDKCKTIRSQDGVGEKNKSSVNKIYLQNIADTGTLMKNLAIGNINAVYDDLAFGPTERVRAQYGQMPMNNIVILKVNRSNELLANPTVRQCISKLLDRDSLVNTGLEGYGVKTSLPYNPRYYATKDIRTKTPGKDAASNYIRKAFKGKTISILTDADNLFKTELATELQKQLRAMGISSNIASLHYEAYVSAANGGGYDITIAEYKLDNSMDLSVLMPDEDTLKVYSGVLLGTTSYESFLNWYQKNMPFITIAYRNGLLAYANDLKTAPNPLPDSPYADAYDWDVG